MTEDEAEARKLDQRFTDDWASATQVRDWASSIGTHVAEYVLAVRDQRWLYDGPSLEVALTGGSSVVPGLASVVLAAAREALRERRVPARLTEATELMNTKLPGVEFDDVAEYGRRAVSLGAADPEIPAFRQIESIDPDPGGPGLERFPTRGV